MPAPLCGAGHCLSRSDCLAARLTIAPHCRGRAMPGCSRHYQSKPSKEFAQYQPQQRRHADSWLCADRAPVRTTAPASSCAPDQPGARCRARTYRGPTPRKLQRRLRQGAKLPEPVKERGPSTQGHRCTAAACGSSVSLAYATACSDSPATKAALCRRATASTSAWHSALPGPTLYPQRTARRRLRTVSQGLPGLCSGRACSCVQAALSLAEAQPVLRSYSTHILFGLLPTGALADSGFRRVPI